MSNDQKTMKSSELDSGAFSVLYDAERISLEILYKGVPVQIIAFGTSSPQNYMRNEKEVYQDDAQRIGRVIQAGFEYGDPIPFHLEMKARLVEAEEQGLEENWWKGNVEPLPRSCFRHSLNRILNNAERNYRWYESQAG